MARTAGASNAAHPIGACSRSDASSTSRASVVLPAPDGPVITVSDAHRDLAVDVAQVAHAGARDADPLVCDRHGGARRARVVAEKPRPDAVSARHSAAGGPWNTSRPPARPPPGPISTTSSAIATATRSCSTISTGPGSEATASSSRFRSVWCSPMVGSSRTCSRSSSRPASTTASRVRCASPRDSVGIERSSARWPRPSVSSGRSRRSELVLDSLRRADRPAAARRTSRTSLTERATSSGSVTPATRCDDVSNPSSRNAAGSSGRTHALQLGQIGARSTGVPPRRTSCVAQRVGPLERGADLGRRRSRRAASRPGPRRRAAWPGRAAGRGSTSSPPTVRPSIVTPSNTPRSPASRRA